MRKENRMFSPNDLIDIHIKVLQGLLPNTVDFRGKKIELTKKEKIAAGRAIWYILKKGYGISSAVSRASCSLGVKEIKVERACLSAFPEGFFKKYDKTKQSFWLNKL